MYQKFNKLKQLKRKENGVNYFICKLNIQTGYYKFKYLDILASFFSLLSILFHILIFI